MRRFPIGRLFLACLFLNSASTAFCADEKDAAAGTATYAEIEIKGAYHEGAQLPGLFGEMSETLDAGVLRIEKAATDEKIDGVILRINSPTIGWAKMNAFRKAIGRVQAKGKKVHAWLEGASNIDYLLASACDEIVMPEPGVLMMVGLRAEVTFYKNLFDMIGVKADILRVGAFKSAAEPYSRTGMSDEFRKEMEEILDDRYKLLVDTIAASPRKMTAEKVTAAIDDGPLTSARAKTLGLIDSVGYEDDLESALSKAAGGKTIKVVKKYGKKKADTDFSGLAGMMKMMEMLTGAEPAKRKTANPKLAIIYATGAITSGKSQSDLFSSESTMGSETMIKAIREANKDATVKAIVLKRVDSPGGSAAGQRPDVARRLRKLVKEALRGQLCRRSPPPRGLLHRHGGRPHFRRSGHDHRFDQRCGGRQARFRRHVRENRHHDLHHQPQ